MQAEKDSDVEDDSTEEPDAKKGNEQSGGEESDEKDDEGTITVNDFQGKSFDIGQTIDLKSKDLADVLAKKDLTQPCVAAPEKVLSEEDWVM